MAKKFVAFLDILGFKDLVEHNSADKLSEIYSSSLRLAIREAMEVWKADDSFLRDEYNIKMIAVSDSIVIWGENDNQITFLKLCVILKSFISQTLQAGLPMRGGLEYGEISFVDSNELSEYLNDGIILLGEAITSAYQLEQKQNWAGCIVTENAIAHYEKLIDEQPMPVKGIKTDLSVFIMLGILIKYTVPLKSGSLSEYYCIDWTGLLKNNPVNEQVIRGSFARHGKLANNWDVENKIRNTIDFFNFTRKFHTK
jgi:hypothetical protein